MHKKIFFVLVSVLLSIFLLTGSFAKNFDNQNLKKHDDYLEQQEKDFSVDEKEDPPQRTPYCGDGIFGESEQCDDGNNLDGDGCSSVCLIETGSVCGNLLTEEGEECDDGNTESGDGCTNVCDLEFCGDGLVNNFNPEIPVEECDDGNNLDGDGCDASCKLEEEEPFCGDGILDLEDGEQCDDGNLLNNDGCNEFCQNEPSGPVCGNHVLEGAEECDDGNVLDGDGCSSVCEIEEFEPICGNGVVEEGEFCDDGNLFSGDGCDSLCSIEAPAVCGNGVKELGEECDGADMGVLADAENQCSAYDSSRFDSGTLGCFPAGDAFQRGCTISTLACFGPIRSEYKSYKRVSFEPEIWQEFNPESEPLIMGVDYVFDPSIAVSPTQEYGYEYWKLNWQYMSGGQLVKRFDAPGTYTLEYGVADTEWNHSSFTQTFEVVPLMGVLDYSLPTNNYDRGFAIDNGIAWSAGSTQMLTATNVSNPQNIQVISQTPAPFAKAIAANNGYVYLAGSGLHIYAANNGFPELVHVFSPGVTIYGVYAKDNVVILTAAQNGLIVLDVTDPVNPILVSQFILPDNSSARALEVEGSIAYVVDAYAKIYLVDLSSIDFSSPQAIELSLFNVINVPISVYALNASEKYLAVVSTFGDLSVYNVSEPSQDISLVGSINFAGSTAHASSAFVIEDKVYVGFPPILNFNSDNAIARVNLDSPQGLYIMEWLVLPNLYSGTMHSPVLYSGNLFWSSSMYPALAIDIPEAN